MQLYSATLENTQKLCNYDIDGKTAKEIIIFQKKSNIIINDVEIFET